MLPVTIITGWLGAGKTTLLNRILADPLGLRIAVVQNEFGEIGVDGDLVIGAGFPVVELSNGCLCCATNDDFLAVLEELPHMEDPPDHVIVETSGVADPSATVLSILRHPDHEETFVVDGVVCLVDAHNVRAQLAESPGVAAQIAFADCLLLNKVDLVDEGVLTSVRALLNGINSSADLQECADADVPIADMLDIGGFDLARVSVGDQAESGAHDHSEIVAHSFRIEEPLEFERFERWIAEVLRNRGEQLYRMKGIVSIAGNERALVIQGVRSLYNWRYGDPMRKGEKSRIVFIGRDIDPDWLREGLQRCVADGSSVSHEA